MRFKPDTFGLLVRPRILVAASILPVKSGKPGEISFSWTKPRKSERFDHFAVFPKKLTDLFSDLHLGDTSKDLSTCYTAEVTHYIVRFGGTLSLVDKNNVQETLKMVRKRLGARTNLRVVSVGVKFYKGMEQTPDGSLKAQNPWIPKTADGLETIWFYNPWELVPMTEIVKYESVKRGDLILFPKSSGMVVRKKNLNKPRYYSTSSWSCYSITLLNYTADGFTRFLPDRQFTVRRSSDPDEGDGTSSNPA
jgi:hypothetical protein